MIRNRNNKYRLKGFTLIEVLIYLSIFIIVSTAAIIFMVSLSRFIDQYKLETMLYRSGTNVMEQVVLAIRQADQIDLLNTIEDSPANGRLTLENTATTTSFTLDTGELSLDINGTDYGSLTGNNVTVDDFTVYYYDLTDAHFARVRLSLTATLNTGTSKSATFYGGGVIRGDI
jgi:type II secretory pathway pseudopilin PulG